MRRKTAEAVVSKPKAAIQPNPDFLVPHILPGPLPGDLARNEAVVTIRPHFPMDHFETELVLHLVRATLGGPGLADCLRFIARTAERDETAQELQRIAGMVERGTTREYLLDALAREIAELKGGVS